LNVESVGELTIWHGNEFQINDSVCKLIFSGIHRATLFNKFEIMLSVDLMRALASYELNPLLNSWKHKKTKSLFIFFYLYSLIFSIINVCLIVNRVSNLSFIDT